MPAATPHQLAAALLTMILRDVRRRLEAAPEDLANIIREFDLPALRTRIAAFLQPSRKADAQARVDAQRAAIAAIYQAALDRFLARARLKMLAAVTSASPAIALPNAAAPRVLNAARPEVSPRWSVQLGITKPEFAKGFFEAMNEAAREVFRETAAGAVSELGIAAERITDAGIIHDFVITRENKLKDTPDELYDEIKAELETGAQAGETTQELAARLQGKIADLSRERADLIARTEAASAYAEMNHQSAKAAGLTYKRWITADDEKVRDSHLACAAEGPIPMEEPFSNGLMFPGDPEGEAGEVINCRCYIEHLEAPEEVAA